MIRITAIYRGSVNDGGFYANKEYILFPSFDSENKLYVYNQRGKRVTYDSRESFISNWKSIKPYNTETPFFREENNLDIAESIKFIKEYLEPQTA